MSKLLPVIVFLFSLHCFAQINSNTVMPQFSSEKITKIPERSDDIKTQNLLLQMTKTSGWFPELKLSVNHGIVILEGTANDKNQLEWLTKTAGKLPTVIAVVNKATIRTPPITDMTPLFSELRKISDMIKKNVPRVLIGLFAGALFFLIGIKAQGFSKDIWSRKISNTFLSSTVAKLTVVPLWLMLFYLTLLVIGLQNLAGTIIGGTGVLGIVLGFAFKGIAENYLSGLLLAIRSPFTKGDSVKINEYEGLVQNLNMRGTTIMDLDGNLLLIPNTMVISSVVKNTSVNTIKRLSFMIGVGYCDSISEVQAIIVKALAAISAVKKDPAPLIIVESLGASTVNVKVYFWYDSKESSDKSVKSAAIVKSKDMLLAAGMSLPDEAREIVFADTLKIQMLKDTQEVIAIEDRKKEDLKAKSAQNAEAAQPEVVKDDGHEQELLKLSKNIIMPHQGNDDVLTH